MKKVELVKGIHSSNIGFGCSPILGSIGAKRAKYMVDLAIELGINHFDLARSYGYGEAEQFVGRLIKGRRENLVLTSKFGIKATWKAKLLQPVKPILRLVLKNKQKTYNSNLDASLTNANKIYSKFHERVSFNGKEMRKSLEKSLSEIGTDYLDYFLIHDPLEKLICFNELKYAAETLKKEGKIRAWGLAYMRDKELIHQSYLRRL